MARFGGEVAIVAGATCGIGWRTTELSVAEGARIVIAGRRAKEGETSALKLGAACSFIQTDVTDETRMKALVAHALDHSARIDGQG